MPTARLPVFEKFIGDLRAVWSAETDDARRMGKAKPLVEAFVKDPDLKAHSAQWPSTEGRKNLLLYVDPAYDFVVNAVKPDQTFIGEVGFRCANFCLREGAPIQGNCRGASNPAVCQIGSKIGYT